MHPSPGDNAACAPHPFRAMRRMRRGSSCLEPPRHLMDHSLDSTAASSGPATQPAADRPRDGSAGRRRRERYGLLLAALVAAFAPQATATPGPWEEVAISALLATTLLLALWAAEARPRVMRPALAISAA